MFIGQGFDIALLELDPATVSMKNELVVLPLYIRKWHRGLAFTGIIIEAWEADVMQQWVSQLAPPYACCTPSLCAHALPRPHLWHVPAPPAILTPASCCAAKPRNPVPAGTRLALIGFGDVVGNYTYPTTLQRTDLVLERLETCNEAWADKPHTDNFFESTAICAGASSYLTMATALNPLHCLQAAQMESGLSWPGLLTIQGSITA